MSESDFDRFTLIPQYSDLHSREEVNLSTKITHQVETALPLVASPMSTVTEERTAITLAKLGGVGVIHRYLPTDEQAEMVAEVRQAGYKVGAAIGANKMESRVKALVDAQVDFLVGDIAHGDSASWFDLLKWIRKEYGDDIQVISGNIVTVEAARRQVEIGIDGLRVGIGSGSVCETRKVTGVGRNQIKSIAEIHGHFPRVPIVSCGGVRQSGDIVKALAAGASSVIIGRLFASCDESPAPRLNDGRVIYAGMASRFSEEMRLKRTGEDPKDIFHLTTPEGKQDLLDPTGPVADLVNRLAGGVRAGLAYVGARTIPELWEKARWENNDGEEVEL